MSIVAGDVALPSRRLGAASPLRVCIITTAVICDNPRVVKEADALAAAGHCVRVVAFAPRNAGGAARDQATMRGRRWELATVTITRGRGLRALRWLTATVVRHAARLAYKLGLRHAAVRDAAMSKHRIALYRAAIVAPADLVIAHHVPALPPASRAARVLSARLAFDAEDLHAEDRPDTPEFALERSLITAVEAAYLPHCDCITASSSGIADEVARRYDVARPTVILNAFPFADSVSERGPMRPEPGTHAAPRPVSLYWYSQVIGLDRGLQDVLRAMPLMARRAELHLRGTVSDETRDALLALAGQLGVADALHFWPPADPPDLITLAAQHDIGLALEQPVTLNRRLCVTNKLLLYLTAGIPVVATDTPGQRAIVDRIPGASALCSPGDYKSLAAAVDRFAANDAALADAKAKARAAAREQFAWELEGPKLVSYLTSPVSRGVGAASGAAGLQ